MKLALLPVLAAAGFCCGQPASAEPLDWSEYVDEDYDCRVEYPRTIFAEPEDETGAPHRFTGPNEDTYFRVMGAENTSQWTPADIKAKYLSSDVPGRITYERTKDEFLVLSGYRGESIFYTKVSVSEDEKTACILEIAYPRKDRKRFDAIVTRMSRSFTARG